jgi:hypothetical protein
MIIKKLSIRLVTCLKMRLIFSPHRQNKLKFQLVELNKPFVKK